MGMTQNVDANAGKTSTSGAAESPRLDEVEKEVKKLKADVDNFMELKKTVDDLKNTIVDIRALVSEAQNPSNLLKFITNEDDLNSVVQTKRLIKKKLLVDKAAEQSAEAKSTVNVETPVVAEATTANSQTGFTVESIVESKSTAQIGIPEVSQVDKAEKAEKVIGFSAESISEEKGEEKNDASGRLEGVGFAGLNSDASIVHWIYMMLDLDFDVKSIQKICDYCEFVGLMPKGCGVQVSNLVGAIVKARSRNLSAEEVILSIYAAADALGARRASGDLKGLIISVLEKSKADKCSKCGRPRS